MHRMSSSYKYTFNLVKAIALTQSMIRECLEYGGGLTILKCLKLMYLCERQMYESFRKFITYDSFVSMRHGPVLSRTYDLMKESDYLPDNKEQQYWNAHITCKEHVLSIADSSTEISSALDTQEQIIAHQIAISFGDMEQWDLVNCMHEICAEWHNTNSAVPITEDAIAAAVHSETAAEIYARIVA